MGFSLPTLPSLLSLLVPITYLTILVGSLATFSSLYRRRQQTSKLNLTPYFPPHTARNIYLTLLHQSDTQHDLKTVPPSILIAALQERACEDILRIRDLQTRKGPLNTLLQRGVVGDDIWQRLLRAEQELEAELKDVVAEANALAPGWGTSIFQSANEIVVNRMTRGKVDEVRSGLRAEKEAWEKIKEQSRLELEGVLTEKKGSVATSTATAATTTTPDKTREPRAAAVTEGSDEDAVMVERELGAADAITSSSTAEANTSGGGGKKKKKGKK